MNRIIIPNAIPKRRIPNKIFVMANTFLSVFLINIKLPVITDINPKMMGRTIGKRKKAVKGVIIILIDFILNITPKK